MRVITALVLALAWSSTASAQSPYVGASLIGDFLRVSGVTSGDSPNGETLGGALRVGVPLGSQWGVELELAMSGTIETAPDVSIADSFRSIAPLDDVSRLLFPAPEFRSERQLSTISTMAWWSHEVSDRLSLVYLGGVAFTRTRFEYRVSYPEVPPLPRVPPLSTVFPFRTLEHETTSYGADVAVGFEGRIGMTDHLRLTPGIRLQTAAGGWAIRPGIGIQWTF